MSRKNAVTLSLLLLGCAAVFLPAAASASLPKPKTAVIKPFKGFGSVTLGISKAKALGKWGAGAQCASEDTGGTTCLWTSSLRTDYPSESAVMQISSSGKVCGVLIRAGTNTTSGKLTTTGLKQWKTKRSKHKPAVGLSSKLSAAKKALGPFVVEKHGVITAFSSGYKGPSQKQVEEVTIHRSNCPVT